MIAYYLIPCGYSLESIRLVRNIKAPTLCSKQLGQSNRVDLRVAENIPFAQYVELMNGADAILDQLYSYTPSMNPLEAMKRGIVCIGGGEPENYEIIAEKELRPIINVKPYYESVYQELENLVLHPELIPDLKKQSILYVERHHDSVKVARQYADFYMKNY